MQPQMESHHMTETSRATANVATEQPLNELQQTFKGLLQGIAAIALPTHLAFMAIFAWCRVDVLAAINVFSVSCFVVVFVLARRNKVNLALALTGAEVVGHAVIASFIIGWASGFHHYVLLVLPVVVMSPLRPIWIKAVATLGVALAYMGLDLLLRNSTPPHQLPAPVLEGLHYFNIFGTMLILVFMAGVYYFLINRANEALRSKTQDINNMLQNMPQGVLTITSGNLIHPEYSAYLETIFETRHIAQQNMMALVFANTNLGADALSQIEAAASSCLGEDSMNFEFNSHLLVREFDKTMPDGRVKSLALSWSPICDMSDTVEKLMLCVRDVTDLKRLEAAAQDRKRDLEIIGEILAVSQEKFHDFIDGAYKFMDENKRLIEHNAGKNADNINLLFRNMHTIKGNARTYGLLYATNLVHVTEQSYDELRKNADAPWDQATLLAQLDEVKAMIDKYDHINESVLGRKGPGRRGNVEKFLMVDKDQLQQSLLQLAMIDQNDPVAMRGLLTQIGRTLNLVGTNSLEDILEGTLESLPSLARELGKEAPRVTIEDHGIVIRTQVSAMLKNLFTHQLRNSMDHGLETAEARLAQGKTAAGHIDIHLAIDDGNLQIRLRDDGRGLAIAKIRERAVALDLISESAYPRPEDIAQLIFRSGLSTADKVTEVSGRGVGMDAVKGFLEKEGGSVHVHFLDEDTTAAFRRFELVINLPDKYAASPDAAMSFDALRARVQSSRNSPNATAAPAAQ
jgi:HPt (histidine-containing phosphotransfer) domain-containing protein